MMKRIGMQYFLPLAIYSLIAGVLTGVFLIFLQDNFQHLVMGLVALGVLLLSVCLSLMGMVLLDLAKKGQRIGFLLEGIAHVFLGAVGLLYFFFRFPNVSSWGHVFFFLALFGAGLGLIYGARCFFYFSTFRAREEFAKAFLHEEEPNQSKQESPSFDPNQVIEVDAVDVKEEEIDHD